MDVYHPPFIHNDDEYLALLYCLGVVADEYMTPNAKKIYNSLSQQDKDYLIEKYGPKGDN